jgi:hypothetical protein
MLFSLLNSWLRAGERLPKRTRSRGRRLGLETLEDRAVPSGVSGGPGPSGGSGQTLVQDAAIVAAPQSGGQGPGGGNGSGAVGISGPGYPLAPALGPTTTGVATTGLSQPVVVLLPLTGSPGGPSSSLTVVPVLVNGGGPGPSDPGTGPSVAVTPVLSVC